MGICDFENFKNLYCDGWVGGLVGWWVDGGYFWSLIFFILKYINNDVIKLLNIGKKFVTNFLMGLKIWCQVGDFGFDFQNSYGEMYFWKNMLKVRFSNLFFKKLLWKIRFFDIFLLAWFFKEFPFFKPYCGLVLHVLWLRFPYFWCHVG